MVHRQVSTNVLRDNGVEGAPIARFQETGSSGIPRMKGPLCPLTNY